jgi:hypothetical protein
MSGMETEPLTDLQFGAIQREFTRLGYARAERDERLAVSAGLLGLDGLGSTRDLVKGQAGVLLRILLGTGSRAELDALLAPAPGPETPQVRWWEAARALLDVLAGTACLP